MNRRIAHIITPASLRPCRLPGIILLLLASLTMQAQDFPQVDVRLSRQSNTLYNILNQVSRQSGYFFIYDSELVNSDQVVRIGSINQDLRSFLDELLNNPGLSYRLIERHIIIFKTPETPSPPVTIDPLPPAVPDNYITLQGRLLDMQTGKPLPFASISIAGRPIGVPANADGIFRMRIPLTYAHDTLSFAHLGYQTRYLPVQLLKEGFSDVGLEMVYISLQEIVVTYFDPRELLNRALNALQHNYPQRPVNYLSFYREGILSEEQIVNYSEAVIREYAPPWDSRQLHQSVIYKSRNFNSADRSDTIVFKLKAGLQSAIDLDLIRNTPDFLKPEFFDDYDFTASGLVQTTDGMVYVIDFQQKSHITTPLHEGSIYIEKSTLAILKIEFEYNRQNIRKIQRHFIPRQSPTHVSQILSAKYFVSYQPWEGHWHVSHVRGDISLRTRKRNRLQWKEYNVFFERAVLHTQTENVSRFRRRDTFRTNTIFTDQNFVYDPEFWGDYNYITPEKEINKALERIIGMVESKVFE